MSKLSDYSKFDHLQDYDDESGSDDDGKAVTQNPSRHSQKSMEFYPTKAHVPIHNRDHPSPNEDTILETYHAKNPTIPGRFVFYYKSQKIHEWEQTLDTVTMYIEVPPKQTISIPTENNNNNNQKFIHYNAKELLVHISTTHLQVGIKGHNALFLNHHLCAPIDTTESTWYFSSEDSILHIILQKQRRGEPWDHVLSTSTSTSTSTLDTTTRSTSQSGTMEQGQQQQQQQYMVNPLFKQEIQQQLLLERFQEENPGMDFRDAKFNGSVPNPRTYMGGIGYNN